VFCRTNQLAYSMSNALVMNSFFIANAFIVQYLYIILITLLVTTRFSRDYESLWAEEKLVYLAYGFCLGAFFYDEIGHNLICNAAYPTVSHLC